MERKRRGPYGKRKLESDENTELSLSNPYDEVLSLIKDDDNILNIDQFSHEKQTKTIEQTDKHDFSKASGTPANVFETVDMQDEEQTLVSFLVVSVLVHSLRTETITCI